jgi:hypothetical protein
MKNSWRFLLGAAIGVGVGYALVLLMQTPQKPRLRTIYKAPEELPEERLAS